MRRPAHATALLTAALLAAAPLSGAAASSARPAAFCIPIPLIWECDDDAATPEPTATPLPSGSSNAGTGAGDTSTATGAPSDPGATTDSDAAAPDATSAPVTAVPDDGAPVFTQPPAQLGSESLSVSGLSEIAIVTVPLADGTRIPALKIAADSITIGGFALTVRPDEESASLVTTADTMTLSGHVAVYLDSLTATTSDGRSITLGADTPPPADGIEPVLLRVTFGLVGATADRISYTSTDQQLSG